MKLFPFLKRSRTLAGILISGSAAALLLCGAGSVPVENLLPQGALQGDLNAGGHNITNANNLVTSSGDRNGAVLWVIGDSYSNGQGLAAGQDWPTLLGGLPNAFFAPSNIHKLAVTGSQSSAGSGVYTTNVHPHRPVSHGGDGPENQWVSFDYGTNDMMASVSPTTFGNNMQALVTNAKTDGFKVLIFTVMRRTSETVSTMEPVRQQYNNSLRYLYGQGTDSTRADYIFDWAVRFSDPTDEYLFQPDGIHLADYLDVARCVNGILLMGSSQVPHYGSAPDYGTVPMSALQTTGTAAAGYYLAGAGNWVAGTSIAVNAANVAGAHTLPDGVLSANVPLLNGNNTFTGSDAFSTLTLPANQNLPGSPTTTTQAAGDNSTKIATTGFVGTAIANGRLTNGVLAQLAADFSVTGTTLTDSPLAITLTPGTYQIEAMASMTTASTTGGANANGNFSAGDSGSLVYLRASGSSPSDMPVTSGSSSGAGGPIVEVKLDAPSLAGNSVVHGIVTIAATTTYTVQVSQRSAADAANPAVLKQGSYIYAVQIR